MKYFYRSSCKRGGGFGGFFLPNSSKVGHLERGVEFCRRREKFSFLSRVSRKKSKELLCYAEGGGGERLKVERQMRFLKIAMLEAKERGEHSS